MGARVHTGRHRGRHLPLLSAVFWLALSAPPALAQELEPRAYLNAPVGFHAVLFAYTRSNGSILFETTLPIEDVTASLNTSVAGYYHTFPFFGRSGYLGITVPYTWGSVRGKVGGNAEMITRSGLSDARLRFAVNVIGAPARGLADFIRSEKETNVGLSFTMGVPSGQYDSNKLINLGANRWSFKPEVGLSHRRGRWIFEGALGWWYFSANKEPFAGATQEQSSIVSLQGHLSYNLPNRMWAGFDANFFSGGQTRIDGETTGDFFRNARLGATFAVPLGRRHSLKFNYSSGFVTRTGTDFSAFSVAYQFIWLDGS